MLKLHERNETDFSTGELLNDAVNISEQIKINDISVVEFDYPMNDKGRMINENMLVSCFDRVYEIKRLTRKMDGRDILHVLAENIFSYRAQHAFIPNVPDMMGKKVQYILAEALKQVSGFTMFTESELNELGMTWVDGGELVIDLFSTDKVYLWDFIHTLIENCGQGEIYCEGMKFAIVKRIGIDRGVRLSLDKNMKNIDIERSKEQLVTRLYPFGANDMHIKSVNGGREYIDSPNIDKYGIYEGYKDYSDYTDPEDLLAHAKWEFDSDNEDRIDQPAITISGKLVDLSKLKEYGELERIEVGDTVHIFDTDGTEYVERVIEMCRYPFEPNETTISIGHMRRDVSYTIYLLRQKKRELEAVQTTNKQVATRKLAGTVNTDRNEVQSENELLKIVGDLLTISDGRNIRIRLGNYNGEFVFIIYDKSKNEAIYLNEEGKAVFAGTIETMNDCIIQGVLRVGMADANMKGIEFYGDAYSNGAACYAKIVPFVANNEDYKGISVEGGEFCVAGVPVATETDIAELEMKINTMQRIIDNLVG